MINKILKAKDYPQICKSTNDYKKLALLLHPDKCTDSRAVEAFTHLNYLRDVYENGLKYKDEACNFLSTGYLHSWMGNDKMLVRSYNNYHRFLKDLEVIYKKPEAKEHFMKYIPNNYGYTVDTLSWSSTVRTIPLRYMLNTLEEDKYRHFNWVYSRLIEFCVLTNSLGYSHCGLTPENIFVIPESHGIIISSFYHMTKFGQKVETISGKYKNWYPSNLFIDKVSNPSIDIALAKKLIIACLGDVSGSGVKLRANPDINKNVLTYLMKSDDNPLESMKEWRKILNKNYKSEFINLNI